MLKNKCKKLCFMIGITFLSLAACDSKEEKKDTKASISPTDILPAGVDYATVVNPITGEKGEARKGTLAALMVNTMELNKLLNKEKWEDKDKKKFEEIEKQVVELIPSAKYIGIFDFFTLNEWISDSSKLGRLYVGLLALERDKSLLTEEIKTFLKSLQINHPLIAKKIENLL
ncbi:MAG: hypothetical protein J0H68_02815 [Sphingobacteriia bacterium]|nr:hypothetical protein [Sphingobacteriia bacterium]